MDICMFFLTKPPVREVGCFGMCDGQYLLMATFLEYCCYQYCTSMSELANTSVTPASQQSATITTLISAASSEDQVLAPLQCGRCVMLQMGGRSEKY